MFLVQEMVVVWLVWLVLGWPWPPNPAPNKLPSPPSSVIDFEEEEEEEEESLEEDELDVE